MAVTTIEWTHRPGTIGAVWNIVTGCNKVDRGCKFCYAETMHKRLLYMKPDKYNQPFLDGAVMHPHLLEEPLKWKKPRTVFVNSMSDLFHEKVSFDFLRHAFAIMGQAHQHTFLVLTKRPENALEWWWKMKETVHPYKIPGNIWMGTSVNDQESADKRVPLLLKIDDVLRFVSYEPATGPVNFRAVGLLDQPMDALNGIHFMPGFHGVQARDKNRLHWVICGGESGRKAAPMHPDWARKVRDDCRKAGTPFFFKQWGAWEPVTYLNDASHVKVIKPGHHGNNFLFTEPYRTQNMLRTTSKTGNVLDGETHLNYPE